MVACAPNTRACPAKTGPQKWFVFYSSQMEIVYQAGRQLQKVDNANKPIPEILLCVPWKKPLRKNNKIV